MSLRKCALFGKHLFRKVTFGCSRRYLTVLLLAIISFLLYSSIPQELSVIDASDYRNRFYISLFDAIQEAAPTSEFNMDDSVRDFGKCEISDIGAYDTGDKDIRRASFSNLFNCFHLNDDQKNMLTDKHDKFLDIIKKWKFGESDLNKLFPNDRGIVTVGGGKFSVISLTMIETLRDRGTMLPVEVVIPLGDEDDSDYCSNVLPKLGAKCLFMRDLLPAEVINSVKIQRYQNKVISILLSSFKEVIYIDADCLPLSSLDDTFEKSAYKKYGMILWPDIWRRVTSPVYYSIARIPVDLKKRVRYGPDDLSPTSRYEPLTSDSSRLLNDVPFHDLKGTIQDPTTEAGEMIINKVQHLPSLLLSAYYNIHSTWYYKMFSQGTSGEGDKETFIAAAHALKLPYYQVKTDVKLDGFFLHKNDFRGIALYQQDFEQDYLAYQRMAEWSKLHENEISEYTPNYDPKKDFIEKFRKSNDEEIDSLFGHVSYYKFEPFGLAENKVYVDADGHHFRGFSRKEVVKKFDLEMFNYKVMEKYLCGEKRVNFGFYKDKKESAWVEMCAYLRDHAKYLENTHESTY